MSSFNLQSLEVVPDEVPGLARPTQIDAMLMAPGPWSLLAGEPLMLSCGVPQDARHIVIFMVLAIILGGHERLTAFCLKIMV